MSTKSDTPQTDLMQWAMGNRDISPREQEILDFARKLERQLSPKWRKEPPDKEGWYWTRSKQFPTPDIVWIYKYGPGLKVNDPSERLSAQQLSPEESGGEWSGPILPPEGGAA